MQERSLSLSLSRCAPVSERGLPTFTPSPPGNSVAFDIRRSRVRRCDREESTAPLVHVGHPLSQPLIQPPLPDTSEEREIHPLCSQATNLRLRSVYPIESIRANSFRTKDRQQSCEGSLRLPSLADFIYRDLLSRLKADFRRFMISRDGTRNR